MPSLLDQLEQVVKEYSELAWAELEARWEAWSMDLSQIEIFEVVGGLMAREVTLVTQLAFSPSIWTDHTAPLILRSMIDIYITLAWIAKDPLQRSRQFIAYGLGQEKLYLEHLKEGAPQQGDDEATKQILASIEAWINSQRFTFLTDVNVGSWSGISTREMAIEAGEYDIYRFAYQPFSAATHSMWNHIAKYNLCYCRNPLHRYHRIPDELPDTPHPDYLFRAAKYLKKTFDLFDVAFGVHTDVPSALRHLEDQFKRLREADDEDDQDGTES
jgi:hypothetical protein